ncbi:MAG TPA: alpha/beta hydrolase [Vineibacter sp.]|nr:alpha/beta hydrolase [Vineibacter sp.]
MSATWHPASMLGALLPLFGRTMPPPPIHAGVSLDALRAKITVGAPLDAPISYLRAGSAGARRLILVHGTPGRATQWADYLVEPPPGLETVAIDRPGFGMSGPDGAVLSLDAQAAAVAAVLGSPERPSILVGHSLGGPIVALVAAWYPDRVAAVILLAAAVDPALERIHPLQPLGNWAPVRALLGRTLRNANAELMALKSELGRLAPQLAAIRAPVVIVHGTDDDRVPFANVAYLQRKLGGACRVETTTLQGANHFLPWTDAKAVRAAIARAEALSC